MKLSINKFFVKKEKPAVVAATPTENVVISAEAEKAAIAMALHLFYQDVHDKESYVITIQEKQTSWNSKIYGLNNLIKL